MTAECYLCCKSEKGREEGRNQWSQSERLIFCSFSHFEQSNNQMQVQFVCVKRDLPLYFGGICVQRDSDTLKTFKSHLALNKAPATTCPPSKTFFLFLFFLFFKQY